LQLKALQNFHKTGKTETKNRKGNAVNFHFEGKKSNHTQHHRTTFGELFPICYNSENQWKQTRNLGTKLLKKIPQKIISWSIFHVF